MLTVAASAGSVGVTVTVAVLVAAVLHAAWNALAHAIADQLVGFALIGAAVTAGATGIVLASPTPARASWPFLAGSAVLHVAYNLLLMRCYRLGEFGQVYPLARGTSPWLVAIGAALFAGEHLPPIRLVGVLVVSLGLATLVFAGGIPTRAARPAIAAALLTGVTIATYTTVDGIGVRPPARPRDTPAGCFCCRARYCRWRRWWPAAPGCGRRSGRTWRSGWPVVCCR